MSCNACEFEDNQAISSGSETGKKGGAIYTTSSSPDFTNDPQLFLDYTSFTSNSAPWSGGSMFLSSSTFSGTEVAFNQGSSKSASVAFLSGTNWDCTDCTLFQNVAQWDGAVIAVNYGATPIEVSFNGGSVSENTGGSAYGASFLRVDDSCDAILNGVSITDNQGQSTVEISGEDAALTATNTTFNGNDDVYGTIFFDGGTADLSTCDFGAATTALDNSPVDAYFAGNESSIDDIEAGSWSCDGNVEFVCGPS